MRIILITLIIFNTCFAKIIVDSERIKTIKLAKDTCHRITIQKKKIRDLIVYPDKYLHKFNLHNSGNIFVNTTGLESVHLTLISHTGEIQDLRVEIDETIKANPVILEVIPEQGFTSEDFNIWLNSCLNRQLPYGFTSIGFKEEERRQSGIEAKAVESYTNGYYRITGYTVTIIDKNKFKPLFSQMMWKNRKDIALMFANKGLNAGKYTRLYVISKITE